MSTPDHRRATAERNAAGILDAAERLLARNAALTMVSIAAEAGLSRPTVYAHYKTVGAVVEAAVERSVVESLAAFAAAEPEAGPPAAALARMLAASWERLGQFEHLLRGAGEHLPAGAVHRTHETMLAPLAALFERGRRAGAFRADLPVDWLVTMYFAIVHAGGEHAATHGLSRPEVLELVTSTVLDLVTP